MNIFQFWETCVLFGKPCSWDSDILGFFIMHISTLKPKAVQSSEALRWELIKENKKVWKQEKTLLTKKAINKKKKENMPSTKKAIKKKEKYFFFFLGRFLVESSAFFLSFFDYLLFTLIHSLLSILYLYVCYFECKLYSWTNVFMYELKLM